MEYRNSFISVSTKLIWIQFNFLYSKVSLIFPLHYLQTCLSVNVSMYPKNRNFTIKYQHINVLSSDRDGHASFESKHVLIYLWKGDTLSFTYMIRMRKYHSKIIKRLSFIVNNSLIIVSTSFHLKIYKIILNNNDCFSPNLSFLVPTLLQNTVYNHGFIRWVKHILHSGKFQYYCSEGHHGW